MIRVTVSAIASQWLFSRLKATSLKANGLNNNAQPLQDFPTQDNTGPFFPISCVAVAEYLI
jgi:hypothetical protein